MSGYAPPQQMAVNALKLGHNNPQVLGAGRNLGLHYFFNRLHKISCVRMRADSAYTLDHVKILGICPGLACFFYAAVIISKTYIRIHYAFTVYSELEMPRLL